MSTFFRKFSLYLSLISLVFGLFNFGSPKQVQAKIFEPVSQNFSSVSVVRTPESSKETSVVNQTNSSCPTGVVSQSQSEVGAINSSLGVYTSVSSILFSSANCVSNLATGQASIQNNLQVGKNQITQEVVVLKKSPVSIAVNFNQPAPSTQPQTAAIAFVFSAIVVAIKKPKFSRLILKTAQNSFEIKTLSLSQLGVMRC